MNHSDKNWDRIIAGEADYTAYGFLHWGVKQLYHLKEQQVIQQRLTAGNAKIMLKEKKKKQVKMQ